MTKYGPARIFLARHGQSTWNEQKRVSGQGNPPLTDSGKQQAQLIAEILQRDPPTAIYTSTLTRAVETAQPTALEHNISIQTKDALKEIHMGVLEGRFRDDRDPEAQQLWRVREHDKWHYRIPGGETYEDLAWRALPCLDEILTNECDGTVLIVGHRNTNRVLLGALLHWPSAVTVTVDPKSKYLYEIVPGEIPSVRTITLSAAKFGVVSEGFHA